MPTFNLQRVAAPQPIPANAVQDGCCLPYVIANVQNSAHPYAVQRNAGLTSVSLNAAAYYFDFWTEVCAMPTGDKPDGLLLDILQHFRNVANNGANKEAIICIVIHSLIPSPQAHTHHCAALLIGEGVCYGIDAINGVARIPESLTPEALAATTAFLHWDYILRFALEIDSRDTALAKVRRYHRDELAHILEAPLLP